MRSSWHRQRRRRAADPGEAAIASLDLLAAPARALMFPGEPAGTRWSDQLVELAEQLHAAADWPVLAQVYQHAADVAWRDGCRRASVRLLLAERVLAQRAGDEHRVLESTFFLASRHRLQASFVAAEAWAWQVVRAPVTPDSAVIQVGALRELASVREMQSRYESGLLLCDQAEALCRQYAEAPGMAAAHVKTLLHRSVLERLQGAVDRAAAAVRQAAELAEAAGVDELTLGMVALREGGLQIVIGRAAEALASYQAAERHFADVSTHNLLLARTRQIAPLRALGRLDEALAITDDLAGVFRSDPDPYRLGQVLLERAEVLHDLGDLARTQSTLEAARPLFEQAGSLEAMRWHTHMARILVNRGTDMSQAEAAAAIGHLCYVLRAVATPGHGDITRTLHALHNLSRIPEQAGVPYAVRLAACRAALLAAELQRDSLSSPAERWSMGASREEIYAAAILLHAAEGDSEAVARITEAGRADVLNQLLSAGRGTWAGPLTSLPVVPGPADPALSGQVIAAAEAIRAALEEGAPLADSARLPGGAALPPAAELDELADAIVMTHLAHNGVSWVVLAATRWRGGSWDVVAIMAPAAVGALLDQLAAGELLPPRGISAGTWQQLSACLLPDPLLWAGAAGRPSRLLICPDPRLWRVPYAGLRRIGIHLAETAEVTLTPSLRTSVLLRARAEHRAPAAPGEPACRPALAVLDKTLPGCDVEAAALRSWPGGQRLLSAAGGIPPAGEHAMLYVSGHGDKAGADSALGPGRITLQQLAAAELPRIVFLNGCWSGATDGQYGQDPFSLAVGALIGGADAVAAGIGHIDSAASAHVAARTLGHLETGMPLAAALRSAQDEVRSAHPELTAFDWAGLCAVGLASAPA